MKASHRLYLGTEIEESQRERAAKLDKILDRWDEIEAMIDERKEVDEWLDHTGKMLGGD